MHPIIAKLQQREITRLTTAKTIPVFKAGDTVKVSVSLNFGNKEESTKGKAAEGAKNERIQAFEGIVISRRNRGLTSCFTVRKISSKEGVDRTFMVYAPNIKSIEVVSRGVVRRAKLYYLRKLTGKAAKIKQKFH
jgi:large subunit ribosomal protein L19